jgi:hypothetical protein
MSLTLTDRVHYDESYLHSAVPRVDDPLRGSLVTARC